jgi:hypothetical protein
MTACRCEALDFLNILFTEEYLNHTFFFSKKKGNLTYCIQRPIGNQDRETYLGAPRKIKEMMNSGHGITESS